MAKDNILPVRIRGITLDEKDLEFNAIRSQGSGGQNVNKVSTAIHLRFNIRNSSLSERDKSKLLAFNDHRISNDGIIVIKAQTYRSQEKNRQEAVDRLLEIISHATAVQRKRLPTKPTRSSQNKRLDKKAKHSKTKTLRAKISI